MSHTSSSESQPSGSASLPAALRAAAEETLRGPASRSLRALAAAVESGVPVAHAASTLPGLNASLRGAFAAAARTSDVGATLLDILHWQNEGRWRRRHVLLQLGYPALVLLFAVALFCCLQLLVVRQFETTFREFGLSLSTLTRTVLWWSRVGAWMLLALTGVVAVSSTLAALMLSRPAWHRLLGALPLLGPLWRRAGHAEATRVLSTLTGQEMPLPQAVALAGPCCSNRDVAQVWAGLEAKLAAGAGLAAAVAEQNRIPAEIVPFVQWGEASKCVPESLQSAGELLAEQAEDHGLQLQWLLPPALFAIVVAVVLMTVASLFLPLMALIQWLS